MQPEKHRRIGEDERCEERHQPEQTRHDVHHAPMKLAIGQRTYPSYAVRRFIARPFVRDVRPVAAVATASKLRSASFTVSLLGKL